MAKKSNKKKKAKPNLELSRKIRYLDTIIKYSLRAADGKSEVLDELFKNQANKAYDELEKLKKDNGLL